MAELSWQQVFSPPELQQLIAAALERNFDVKIAAARVLELGAELGVARAPLLPSLDAVANVDAQQSSLIGVDQPAATRFQVAGSLSWELDLWGRIRRGTEAARARVLGAEWAVRGVRTSLVAEVATSYMRLQAIDGERQIAERAAETRAQYVQVLVSRERSGLISHFDVKRAEQLVLAARAQVVALELQAQREENQLAYLLGDSPRSITRMSGRERFTGGPIPAGLPAALLEQRPDLQEAEQALVAQNALVGAAKANFFPNLTLTAVGGLVSASLQQLVLNPQQLWVAAAGLVQPLFDGGRRSATSRAEEARREQALLQYQKAVQAALREVADALVGHSKAQELSKLQAERVEVAREVRGLATARYESGAASYLDVLSADSDLLELEQAQVRADFDVASAYVAVYRALGGGWR